jgi:hypothetical protein
MARKAAKTMRNPQTTLMIAVAPGSELPAVGGFITCTSPMTGIVYAIRVSSIRSLRWLPDGDLEVTVRGTRSVATTLQEGGEG